MGFVRTPEEITRIQNALSKPRFVNAEMLSVDFLTKPETIERLLPPGLEPTGTPRVTAMVGRWQSNCVGDFDGGAIYLEAKHKQHVGDYVLAMYMDRDQPIIYGRELFGEPKKQSTSRLFRRGNSMNGLIERYGTRLIELDVELDTEHEPADAAGINFNYKAIPNTNGIGFEWDPVLTMATFDLKVRANREGSGRVTLNGNEHDPLQEIEIVQITRGAYLEGDLIARCETLTAVDPQAFLPYALGRTDDWSQLNTEQREAAAVIGARSAA